MITTGIILVIGMLYLALAIVFYLHEVGHFGERIHFKFSFPLPLAWSERSNLQYGGLAANALIFTAIWYYNPEYLFVQVIGLVAWIHFIWYLIWGSFNYEPKVPRYLWKYFVFDDVDNKHWFIAVPVAVLSFFYFKEFYIDVIITLINML